MSIIPGIENFAPLRTLTSSGFPVSPNFIPVDFSTRSSAFHISGSESLGKRFEFS